jgi:hypothetical protein
MERRFLPMYSLYSHSSLVSFYIGTTMWLLVGINVNYYQQYKSETDVNGVTKSHVIRGKGCSKHLPSSYAEE